MLQTPYLSCTLTEACFPVCKSRLRNYVPNSGRSKVVWLHSRADAPSLHTFDHVTQSSTAQSAVTSLSNCWYTCMSRSTSRNPIKNLASVLANLTREVPDRYALSRRRRYHRLASRSVGLIPLVQSHRKFKKWKRNCLRAPVEQDSMDAPDHFGHSHSSFSDEDETRLFRELEAPVLGEEDTLAGEVQSLQLTAYNLRRLCFYNPSSDATLTDDRSMMSDEAGCTLCDGP